MRLLFWLVLAVLTNYEEAAVPPYTLPPLGDPAQTLQLFRTHVYGTTPTTPVRRQVLHFQEDEVAPGLIRGLVELQLNCQGRSQSWQLLTFRPPGKGPFPLFLGLNFCGNQSVYPDPAIPLARGWVDNASDIGIKEHRATESSRGGRAYRWPVERIVSRGYAVCTLYYGDVDPDFDDGFHNGAHGLLNQPEGWGSIAAWAWGLSRCADYLQEQPWVSRMGVVGHSRLGKAALWAGAQDPRFGLVLSNDSGCGGAALSKRIFGETVASINKQFPHWFCARFHSYDDREAELPVDQHQLLALMSSRLVYVASAASDLWADPRGEELAVQAARPAFERDGGHIGYHCRPGVHNLYPYDWERFMDFADRYWR